MIMTQEHAPVYADESLMTTMFGNSAKVKILAALLSEDFHHMNVTDIARLADVHRSTVYDNIDDLQKLGIVAQTREISGSPMYQLNRDSDLAKHLRELKGDLETAVAEDGQSK